MLKILTLFAPPLMWLVAGSVCSAQENDRAGLTPLKTMLDSVSYAIGMNIGMALKLKQDSIILNPDLLKAGLTDGADDDTTRLRLSEPVVKNLLADFKQQMQQGPGSHMVREHRKKDNAHLAWMETTVDSVSYAIGMNIGKGLKQDSVILNADLLKAGLTDGADDDTTRLRLSDSVAQMVLTGFQQQMMQRSQARMMREQEEKGSVNRKKGDEFLAANKSKPGVRVTPSGLQYIVMNEGKGDSPDLNDVVKVYYRGTLIDGTEFDKSQGEPVEFPVDGVIPGWTEALQLMKPGGKWKLFIPAHLAYGELGAGPRIGPNETLIFEVELVSVNKQ